MMSDELIPKIIVDTREADSDEKSSDVLEALQNSKCELEYKSLNAGDYILSDRIAVEVKASLADFCKSLQENRLFDQIGRLASSDYEHPALMICGSLWYSDKKGNSYTSVKYYDKDAGEYKNTSKRLNRPPDSIRGALNSIRFDYDVHIIGKGATNAFAGANELLALAKREQKEEDRYVTIQTAKKSHRSVPELQRLIVESLPGVGKKMAEKILNIFETPKKIVLAGKEGLIEVDGIGEKTAKKIIEVIETEYESIREDEED